MYGFDFDYTLLQYTSEVHRLIYTMARKRLIDKLSVSHKIDEWQVIRSIEDRLGLGTGIWDYLGRSVAILDHPDIMKYILYA